VVPVDPRRIVRPEAVRPDVLRPDVLRPEPALDGVDAAVAGMAAIPQTEQ
jgi:hypothetical protein